MHGPGVPCMGPGGVSGGSSSGRGDARMPMASSLAIRSISSACSSSSGSDEQTVSMSVGRDDGVVGTVLA